jgi:LPS sulfotransferase NodH
MPLYGKVTFALGARAPEDAPDVPSFHLFSNGLARIVGNFAAGRGGGISTLADERTFMVSLRRLADDLFHAAGVTVDWSPGDSPHRDLIEALYPDATIVETVSDDVRVDATPASYESPLADRLVIVCGCPRSGTTWLEQLLLAHPGTAGVDEAETWLFLSLRSLWDNDALRAAVPPAALATAQRRFCDAMFTALLERAGRRDAVFVEKTPANALHLREIAALYPDAWFVHILRDGRDVARSIGEFDLTPAGVREGARAWAATVRAVDRDAGTLPRFREVRYEELLGDPAAGAASLLTWAGLAVDERVRDRLAARADGRVSRYNTTGPVGAGKWRSLSPADLRAVYEEAGESLAALGYATAEDVRATARVGRIRRWLER